MGGACCSKPDAARTDPSAALRWLSSKFLTRAINTERLHQARGKIEQRRRAARQPHLVEYFHQLDDGYSHLAAQLLAPLVARYDIELRCHLVSGAQGGNAAEPELLSRLSRYDSAHIASQYGLEFPQHDAPLQAELVQQASAILAAQPDAGFIDRAAEVGRALWSDDADALKALAGQYGSASSDQTRARITAGTARQKELKHYSGAMFYYGEEWYWGVDRLYHLEQRLIELGAAHQAASGGRGADDRLLTPQSAVDLLSPRPKIDAGELKDDGRLTLEVFASVRSPYTALVFDRAVQLARDAGVKLVLRPVLPMVMRGVPATLEKGMYIFKDAAREAQAAGVPFGNFYDPIGEPARRCYSLYPWAAEQGKGVELISSFLRAAFAEGVNTNNDRGLKTVVENAGLDWQQAQSRLGQPGWEDLLEQNRLALSQAGLWGVPSFRLLDEDGEQVLALWGQDRLWLFARKIQELLATPKSKL